MNRALYVTIVSALEEVRRRHAGKAAEWVDKADKAARPGTARQMYASAAAEHDLLAKELTDYINRIPLPEAE